MSFKFRSRAIGLACVGVITLSSCGTKKVNVKKTPSSNVVYKYQNNLLLSGYPKYAKPWVVYADKENAAIYPNKKFELANKQAKFFEPYIVISRKGDMYKVVKYEPGTIVDSKIDKELVQGFGWLHKDDLLLWNESLRNETNGFRLKGILAINDKSIIKNSQLYIQNDSVVVYKDPSLLNPTDLKLPINDIVYLYKFTDDHKRALIGGSAMLAIDEKENGIYGWVDTRILSVWGERTAFKILPAVSGNQVQLGVESDLKYGGGFSPVVQSSTISDLLDVGHLYPVGYSKQTDDFEIRYLDNVLDFSENKIYNVLGSPIYYKSYREILRNNRKLNLVFVIDGAKENFSSLAALKSVVQELESQMTKQDYFYEITFSAVYYNVDKAYKSDYVKFSKAYHDLSNSLDKRYFLNSNSASNISLYESIEDLNELLSPRAAESNLVVVIGNTLESNDKQKQSALTHKLAETNSRLIFYQVKANKNDDYNDFVLLGEKVIKESSKSIVDFKKQRLVNHDDVVEVNEFDVSKGNQGIYRLDYPENSIHQGVIVFPRKGEENKPILLQEVVSQTMHDMVRDNKNIDSTLTSFFKSDIGVSHTKIKAEYYPWYQQEGTYVSTTIAKQVLDQDYSFLHQGVLRKQNREDSSSISYGILVDEYELDQLRNYYLGIYAHVFRNNTLNNRRLVRRYMTVAREKSLLQNGVSRKFLRTNPMHIGLFQSTGLYLSEPDSLSTLKLNKWKRKNTVNPSMLEHYFRSFKIQAEKISEDRGSDAVRINQHGVNFYWLNQDYLPILDFTKARERSKSFELLPVELEKMNLEAQQKEQKESQVKDYIERVKKGMP